MSSPCLSGGGRSYGFELERVKPSPSAASTATASASAITSSLTSSPSSTLSESSNSPLAISTRKPRTPRKRPNQTYNEAAALLSTVYPNIFSTITNHHKFTAPGALLLDQPSDLLLSPFPVFDAPGFLLHHQYHNQNHYRPIHKPNEPRLACLTIPSYQSCGEVDSPMETTDSTNSMEVCEEEDDFDTGSILDEEIGEGIDSIMGNLSVANEMPASSGGGGGAELNSWRSMGYNYGGKFQPGIRAFRNLEERNWWCFPIVDMLQISPRLSSNTSNREPEKEKNSTQNSNSNTNPKLKPEPDSSEKRKKKKKKKVVAELEEEVDEVEKNWNAAAAQPDKQSLLLKLNYKEVLDAWSDRGSPYSDQGLGSADGKDAAARLGLIDLFSEGGGGGIREASVLRYKEKRRTRLFSKKIRYQVRKVNADRRPRMKGRFVRRLSSSSSGQRREK